MGEEKKTQSPTQNQAKKTLQHIKLPFTVVSSMFNEGHMSKFPQRALNHPSIIYDTPYQSPLLALTVILYQISRCSKCGSYKHRSQLCLRAPFWICLSPVRTIVWASCNRIWLFLALPFLWVCCVHPTARECLEGSRGICPEQVMSAWPVFLLQEG